MTRNWEPVVVQYLESCNYQRWIVRGVRSASL